MDKKKEDIKEYVENKILTYTFHAKNFSKEDMDRADTYCKKHFGNDRKKMILTLISLVENNVAINAVNDKLNAFADFVLKELDNINIQLKPNEEIKKVVWKGFGK